MTTHTVASGFFRALIQLLPQKHLVRALSAAALLLSGLTTPQAIAQCGPVYPLTDNEWIMVGVPCEPNPGTNTIADFFGSSTGLGAANYDVTWVIYYRTYNEVGGVSDDNYVRATGTETVSAGDAYWIWTDVPATLDFSAASATAGPFFDFPGITADTLGGQRYYLFSNPYGNTVNFADFRWTGDAFGPFDLSTAQATGFFWQFTTGIAHYWNGNSYDAKSYDGVDPATFEPREGAWLEMSQGLIEAIFDNITGLTVRVPDPGP